MIAYDEGGITVHLGDCREVLATLPNASVQTVVTSPPYYGLRSYLPEGHADKASEIGLEATVEAYVAEMVAVFRDVRRVLADDGTLWLNLGDSYASSNPGGPQGTTGQRASRTFTMGRMPSRADRLPPKNLIGIPWRVAFGLQADGWYLRQDIIWAKPNPMPESVTDRCTKAHEYVFLLSKSPRYLFDADAIAEPYAMTSSSAEAEMRGKHARGRSGYRSSEKGTARADGAAGESRFGATSFLNGGYTQGSRNKRSVWNVSTTPFADAHFATFPRRLVEPCVLAGSRPGDVVLDPFAGSGTTLQVAKHLGRRAIGIELNPDYLPMIERRLAQHVLPLEDAA